MFSYFAFLGLDLAFILLFFDLPLVQRIVLFFFSDFIVKCQRTIYIDNGVIVTYDIVFYNIIFLII